MTVRVTKTETHLEQIHHIGIVNEGPAWAQSDLCAYAVYLDGKPLEFQITHYRSDGALALLLHALEQLKQDGKLKPGASAVEEKEKD